MATTKVKDIRETGPQSYKDLQRENRQQLQGVEPENPFLKLKPSNPYRSSVSNIYEGGEMSPMQQSGNGYWGTSQYDNPTANEEEYQAGNMGDTRYENQPWYDTLANGVGKMLGTAGTTFVSSLIGLPYGLFEAANQGRWSALWDNDVTQGLADVDKWLEENMTNYRSQVQQNSPWYDPNNLFSMNFIADDVIKNMGFTLGAAASMAVGSGTLGLMSKSLGFVNDVSKAGKVANNVISALFSATGEGMIEARQGVEERNKLEIQKLDDALAPEAEALRMEFDAINQEYQANRNQTLVRGADGQVYDPAYEVYKTKMEDLGARRDNLNQRRQAGIQQIEESGKEMGNKILLGNQALLTAGNLIQFSKAMTKSFDKARHAAEMSTKTTRPAGVSASRVSNNLRDGYKVSSPMPGRLRAATKGILTEGSEEMNQQFIQSSSGAAYSEQDVNDYWRAKMDPESYRETTKGLYTLGQILDRGFNESWGDVNQWEQFVVGGLTGMSGSYSPTKLFNQDKTKSVWNPMRYGSWEGGAFNEVSDFNKEYNQYKENIDDLNKILASEDFPARVRSMVGHTYTEQEKQYAAEADDKKAFKDADDKQNIHDIQAFLRAGKLDDLRAIYQEMGGTLSDEDVENIVKATTREVTAEEDKQQHDQQIDTEIATHQRKISELQEKAQDIADQQEQLTPAERAGYQAAVTPALEGIFADIDKEYEAIDKLEQEKAAYVPQKHYAGAYVDREGNRTATPDEIRAEHTHNAEELNRKLDSYLESIDYVNRRTNGQLTKDQEDNLAYLHNMGKLSNERMQKIMAGVRQQLPKKFLLKTNKTPEQLTQEYASSDLSFSKDENTKEGYVEVDTSLMNDAAFADFFQREIMRGGNINPEFAETAEEQAAREEEEKNLSDEEKKKKARERASKKWKDAIQKMQDDAGEQWDTNWKLLVDNFMDNYRTGNNATLDETIEAFGKIRQDIQDASDLYDQAGEFQRTLMEYMQNPSLVDKAKEKEENKANKTEQEQRHSNQFEGKDAKQMTQELANGVMDEDEFFDFANMDLSGDAPEPLKTAQQEAKKTQEIRQRQAAMKNHIQESLGENPSPQDLEVANLAMQMVDNAALNAENPEDLNIDMPELNQVPVDAIDHNASIDDIDNLNQSVQSMLADAFNAMEEDRNARNDIPDMAPVAGEEEGAETGHDPVTKTVVETAVPINPSGKPSGTAAQGTGQSSGTGSMILDGNQNQVPIPMIVPKSPLTEGAVNTIIDAMQKVYSNPATAGTWRSTTTRHPYGRSTGTYHEDIAKQQFGENSKEYKRSKAIWEYLNATGAFDRMENPDADRIKPGDTIHFMVKYLPQVFDENDFKDLTEEEKPYAMVIIMLNDNGEILGDLPLEELEPSYKAGNPTQQVKDLMSLQKKVFDAFTAKKQNSTANEMVVDSMPVDGADNLNLTFDNAKKTPLVSQVKQVMRGVVPFSKTEKHTLNEVANGQPFELGVKVTGTTVAKKKGDKTQHKEIVIPGVGSVGQPYLLVKTASGEQMAVPFYMPQFNPEQHKATEMYKLLSNAVYHMLANNNQSARGKEAYRKHMDVIEGLLQVKAGEGRRVIEITPDHIALHFVSLTDPNQEINIQIPKTDNLAQDAQSLVNQMAGIPINVSLQFLNDKIETGLDTGDKYTRTYNEVIGEIADINLPQNTQHTTNSWFTVELVPSAGIKPSRKVQPKITGKYNEVVNGKNIEFDTDNLIAVDTATGEVIVDDSQIDLMLAEIQANKPINKGKKRIQVSINGELKTYDVEGKKFVKNPTAKPEIPTNPIAQGAIGFGEDAQFQKELDAAVQYVTNHPYGTTFELSKATGATGDRLRAIVKALIDQYGMDEWDGKYRMPVTWLSETMTAGLGSAFGDDSAMAEQIKESNSNWMNTTIVKDTWKSEYKESLALSKKDSLTPKEFLDILKKKYANSQDLLRRLKSIEKYNMDEFSAIVDNIKSPAFDNPIDILVAWAEGKLPQETAFKMLEDTDYVKTTKPNPVLHTGDGTHFTNKVEIELGKYIHEKYPFLTTGNVKVNTGVSTFGGDMGLIIVRDPEGIEYGTPSNFLRSLATGGERSTAVVAKYTAKNGSGKSLNEIEQMMKDNKVVGRQTKDAWDAIPGMFKQALVNDGAYLQLSYNGKTAIISYNNLPAMKEALKEANMAAKAGSLTVTEAAKPMENTGKALSRENEQAARRWLAKNLPMLSSEERTQFVDRLARMGDNAGKFWGSYRSGVIEIQRNAPMGTVYHEAFHYVLDMILSPEERMEVLNIAKQEYGIDDIYAAEERLANDFRRYAMDENAEGIIGRIKRWLRKITDKMNRYNRISESTINNLFWKINNGELAQKSQEVESFEDQQQRVLMEIRNVQKEKLAWNNLSRETKAALKDSGLSEAAYSEMSLEEKQQYVRCRG